MTKLIVDFCNFVKAPKNTITSVSKCEINADHFGIKLFILLGTISCYHEHQLDKCSHNIAKNMQVECQIISINGSVCKHRYKQIG
jgi:hypothetical protein